MFSSISESISKVSAPKLVFEARNGMDAQFPRCPSCHEHVFFLQRVSSFFFICYACFSFSWSSRELFGIEGVSNVLFVMKNWSQVVIKRQDWVMNALATLWGKFWTRKREYLIDPWVWNFIPSKTIKEIVYGNTYIVYWFSDLVNHRDQELLHLLFR